MTKHKAFVLFMVLVAFAFLSIISCSDQATNSDRKFSTGHKLSEGEISELKDKITDVETSDAPTVQITEYTVYYWTDSGAKLHLFKTCQALSKSDSLTIKQGLLEDAYYANKSEPCSFCLKIANLTADSFPVFLPSTEPCDETTKAHSYPVDTSESNATAPDDERVYIWTKSGSKLHIFENCTYLSKTPEESKIRGNKEAALEHGISEICSRCQKNSQDTD